jgi:ABC-2 type transport system ATP-binding protein
MLELRGVGFSYPGAERPALRDVDLHLQPGECLGLLGANGAGKTTLLSLISGLLPVGSGSIVRSRGASIGIVPQQLAFYGELKVRENLALFADLYRLHGEQRRQRLDMVIHGTALEALLDKRGSGLSGGEQRRLNFAIGLLQPAALYLFDEATVGVDAQSRQLLLATVESLIAEGQSVIYTSHYLDEIERIAKRILILDHGQVALDLHTRSILGNQRGLLLEWSEQPPAGLADLFAELRLQARPVGNGYWIEQLDGVALVRITQFVGDRAPLPSQLRFGRPSLEQLYLLHSGNRS